MTRPRPAHRCERCQAVTHRWSGRCPACGAWNSLSPCLEEPTAAAGDSGHRSREQSQAVPLRAVDPEGGRPLPTGLDEVDRVLSGGLVPGSLTLLFGEPGVGKSTLLAQVLLGAAGRGRRALLVSAEESAAQARLRAERLGPVPSSLLVLVSRDVRAAVAAVAEHLPEVVVVDSVQTLSQPALPGAAGSPAQVRACAEAIGQAAREHGSAVVLVGHVTKDGAVAGPRTLEHLVDTVVALEGDRHHALRTLRAVKHRHGTTGEVGFLELGPSGLLAVEDPGRLVLSERSREVPGTGVGALLEGRRPLLVEIQALACTGGPPGSRAHGQGIDSRRLATLLAVLECRAGVETGPGELFVSAAGGFRATEPAADLPVALAVASALAGVALPSDLVSFGEIGLAGEVRPATRASARLEEARRLGFSRALVPAGGPRAPEGMEAFAVSTLAEALGEVRRLVVQRPTAPGLVPGTMPRWPTGAASG